MLFGLISILLGAASVTYTLLDLQLLRGLRKLGQKTLPEPVGFPDITVLIAARNEEKNQENHQDGRERDEKDEFLREPFQRARVMAALAEIGAGPRPVLAISHGMSIRLAFAALGSPLATVANAALLDCSGAASSSGRAPDF